MSRISAFICGSILVGGAIYYQRTYVREDVRMLRARLCSAGDQLNFALSKQPYVSAETAAKEYAYTPSAAPNSAFHRLRRLWRERVIPEWRERWNRSITGAADYLTSLEVDVEQLTVKRAKTA
ncbi:hypothetical protein BDF22DRAFT_772898 [Syncephalis plumigaleata]|nr:hypothetical protein BDF22DRAFT_772898 [Syncephalis plumigaleata]